MKAQATGLVLAALLAAPVLVSPVLAQSESGGPSNRVHRVFDIMREGSRIGTDTFDITRNGETTTVRIKTHIQVKIAFVTAYRYDHSETGVWKGKQLVSFKSKTDDNGTPHEVSASQSGGKVALVVDGESSNAPRQIQPASLWGAEVSKQSQIFDPAKGNRMAVRVKDLGEETIQISGVPTPSTHVKLSGPFARDLWFDEDGLVKMTLLGTDNSQIVSQLRQSTASN